MQDFPFLSCYGTCVINFLVIVRIVIVYLVMYVPMLCMYPCYVCTHVMYVPMLCMYPCYVCYVSTHVMYAMYVPTLHMYVMFVPISLNDCL
jgi:hypothetical protein